MEHQRLTDSLQTDVMPRHIIKVISYTLYIHYITFHFKMRHPAQGGNEQKLLPDKTMTAGGVELTIK